MYYIFVLGIFEAVFLFALISTKKNKSLADGVLGGIFLLFGINILTSLLEFYNRQNGYPFPAFIQTTPPVVLLHGPMLWFYIKAQTEQKFRFKAVHLLHFLPFISMIFHFTTELYFLPLDKKILLDSTEGFKQLPAYGFFMMMILISPPAYYVWGLILLRRYKRLIKNYFSQIQNIDLNWLQVLLISSMILALIINGTFFVDFMAPFAPFGLLQAASYIFVSVYVLFLGFFGHKQESLFTKVPLQLIEAHEDVSADKIEKADEIFIYNLLELMKMEKPYLNPDLTISALSEEMKVSEEYLSGILNGNLNRNFFDFINHYRVEDFKSRCHDSKNDQYTLLAIAFDCGFNSKATFNRVFKKNTNLTPGEYKRSVAKN